VESFGKFLARKGILTPDQLDWATQSLVVVGGRLGTNIVELGYLTVEEVDGHLAEHFGVASPPLEWLQRPEVAALQALPADQIRRHKILPMAIRDQTLHLAMVDPGDSLISDDIRFSTGLEVLPYVVSDLHLAFLRERHFDIRRFGRVAALDPEWARKQRGDAPSRKKEASTWADTDEQERAARNREAAGIVPLAGDEELSEPGIFDSYPQFLEPAAESESTESGEAAPDSAEAPIPIEDAKDRAAVIDLTLGRALEHARAVALFLVHKGAVRGLSAQGDAIERRVSGLLLADGSESILSRAAAGEAYHGRPSREGIDEALFDALGRSDAIDVAVFPIRIGERVVNVLYADNGPELLSDAAVDALSEVAEAVSRAYQRIIQKKKQRHC
jgi:hypothetical protein